MRKKEFALLPLLASLHLASPAFADAIEPANMDGAASPKGKIAVGWIDGMFNQCDPASVFSKYVDLSRYKNHPAAAEGDELKMEQGVFKRVCAEHTRADIKIVVVEGDIVAALVSLSGGNKPAAELSEWFRIENGKIVDHWDIGKSMKPGEHAFGASP